MRNASFFYTEQQILDESKDVTRRLNWHWAKPGMRLQAVRKGMGRKAGEPMIKLKVIEIVSVRREPLERMLLLYQYGFDECRREGFPHYSPILFVQMFCEHMNCTSDQEITRVEFKYIHELENKAGTQ